MNTSHKSRLLIALGIFWVILLLFQFSDDSDDTGVQSHQTSVASFEGAAVSSNSQNYLLLADILDHPRQTVALAKPRNIFAPLHANKSVATSKSVAASAVRRPVIRKPTRATEISSGPSPGELAAQRARERLNKYRFLGYLKKGGESQAFLTNGQAIYIVKQGETVEGRVQINKIEPTTIVLSTKVRETGDLVEATIPLTENKQG